VTNLVRKLADLDLDIADDEAFTPDKLRAHLERLYMTVGIGLFFLWKQIARLRSWREWQRTAAFLAAYAAAWTLDCLLVSLFAFLIVLTVFPRSRALCFPHAPPALIDGRTGAVKKPLAGLLASEHSMTGAPEKHPGEATEQEAHSFVNSIATVSHPWNQSPGLV
jgi:hypothetical protein